MRNRSLAKYLVIFLAIGLAWPALSAPAAGAPVPLITTCSPQSAERGWTGDVEITGENTHFATPGSVAEFGEGIVVHSTAASGETRCTANITVDPAAAYGPRNVTVSTDGETATKAAGFRVGGPPAIQRIDPTSEKNCFDVRMYIFTSDFTWRNDRAFFSARLVKAGQPDIEGSIESVDPAGQRVLVRFKCTGRQPALWDVVLSNGAGESAALPAALELTGARTDYTPDPWGYGFTDHTTGRDFSWEAFLGTYTRGQVYKNKRSARLFFDMRYKDIGNHGQCFGMSATSSRFKRGYDKDVLKLYKYKYPRQFGPRFGVTNPANRNQKILDYTAPIIRHVMKYQGYQAGAQVQDRRRKDCRSNSATEVLQEVKKEIDRKREALVEISHRVSGGLRGHSLVAFEYDEVGPEECRVYVYDPDTGAACRDREAADYVAFNTAGDSWSYRPLGWAGSNPDQPVDVIPFEALRETPVLPWYSNGRLLAVAGEDSKVLATDGRGRRFGRSLERAYEEIPGAYRYSFYGGGTEDPESYFLPNGPYSMNVSAASTRCSGAVFSSRLTARVDDSSVPPGENYVMEVSQKNASIKPHFSGGNDVDKFTVYFPGGKGGRACSIEDINLNGGEKMITEVGRGSRSVRIENRGRRKLLNVVLSQSKNDEERNFFIGGVPIEKGESITLEPECWDDLSRTRVKMKSSRNGEWFVRQGNCSYYFAEGCTRPGFDEWLCMQNPSYDTPATVTATYNFGPGQGRPLVKRYGIAPHSRLTLSVNGEVGPKDVSVELSSNTPIIAERPMYFRYKNAVDGGHDVIGALSPSREYYFAEGCTGARFEEWLCIQNPSREEQAKVVVTYTFGPGQGLPVVRFYKINPGSRFTVHVNKEVGLGKDVSIALSSDKPVVAERPMYFLYKGKWDGGHDIIGARSPAKEYYFAEGCTRPGFEEWLSLQNPGARDAAVTVTYMLGTGRNKKQRVNVPPGGRRTLSVNAAVGPGQDVSVRVTSGEPIIAERPIYFCYGGTWTGGFDTKGATMPRARWAFAEGCTREVPGANFHTWLCMQNPGDAVAGVNITFMLANGENKVQQIGIPPRSRKTLCLNREVGPGRDVSTLVEASRPIVCERSMYFSYGPGWNGGHDEMGYTLMIE